MKLFRFLAVWLILLSIPAQAKVMPVEFDAGRNRLLAYMLSHQLTSQHFAHKSLEDISPAAFELYLRQLDPRKRFLLQEDVKQLSKYTERIDEDLRRGNSPLPDAAAKILTKRAKEVEKFTEELFEDGFDPNKVDFLEMDPKKIEYAADTEELRDRWRRILKMQVLETYLDLLEKEARATASSQANKKEEQKNRDIPLESINSDLWSRAMEKVRDRTRLFLHRQLQETRQDHYNRYFNSVANAYDPHTSYMAPTSKEDFDIHMSGSLEGIGALLREEDGHIKVVRIIPGSAAERQGQLQAEDIILAVAEKGEEAIDIFDMRLREAVSYIRGPKGTEVILTVQRPDGTKKTIPIIRDVVQIEETYVKSEVLEGSDGRKVGYIRIPSFYRDFADSDGKSESRNVTRDMLKALHKMKNIEQVGGLILDLRNNGGGSLSDAVTISGLFLPGGPVVQVKDSHGEMKILNDTDQYVYYKGPVIVLINKFSASASEILAAALQDYDRALIIGGDHTHGKGTVQTILDLNSNLPPLHRRQYEDLGALKITIQKFYRINGGSTQYEGVVPDIIVPTVFDHLKSGEKNQEYSLPWDKVEPADFTPWRGFHFNTDKALELSRDFVQTDEDFNRIKESTAKAAQRTERTKIPVSLAAAAKERQEIAEWANDENDSPSHLMDPENSDLDDPEKKPLAEQLRDDPYVELAVMLMNKMVFQPAQVSAVP